MMTDVIKTSYCFIYLYTVTLVSSAYWKKANVERLVGLVTDDSRTGLRVFKSFPRICIAEKKPLVLVQNIGCRSFCYNRLRLNMP